MIVPLAMIVLISVMLVYAHSLTGEPRCESYIEKRLYRALVSRGYKVRTQTRCGPFRIDMTIGRIAIECDGKAYHSTPSQKAYDKRRSSYLYRNGYRSVLRFTGSEINTDLEGCIRKIQKKVGA